MARVHGHREREYTKGDMMERCLVCNCILIGQERGLCTDDVHFMALGITEIANENLFMEQHLSPHKFETEIIRRLELTPNET